MQPQDAGGSAQGEWRRGWFIVVSCAFGMGTGFGLYSLVAGLFIKPLGDEFGWSRAQIAGAGAFGVLSAILMPLVGWLVDRHGARRVARVGLIVVGACYATLAGLNGELAQMYVLAATLMVLGTATTPVVFTRPVNAWFSRSRGAALGLALSGVSLTSVIAFPVLGNVIDVYGWRVAYLVLAAFPLLLGLPLVSFLPPPPSNDTAGAHPVAAATRAHTLGGALTDLRFWLLATAMLCANVPVGGIMVQLQPLLSDKGFDAGTAALLGSVYAAAIAVGRVGGGLLLDRLWAPGVAACCLLVPIGASAAMLLEQPSLVLSALAVASFGLAQGAEIDFVAFFVPRYFGLSASASIIGFLMMTVTLSIVAGSVGYGLVFDRTGTYDSALIVGMLGYGIAAVAVIAAGVLHDRRRLLADTPLISVPSRESP